MSALNGDRARFQKERRRKLHNRARSRALATTLRIRAGGDDVIGGSGRGASDGVLSGRARAESSKVSE